METAGLSLAGKKGGEEREGEKTYGAGSGKEHPSSRRELRAPQEALETGSRKFVL